MSRMRTSFPKIDYPTILDEAWQQHLASKESDAPTVISLFAGCGGSSLGYSMAGYKELLAVEWNDNAVVTFKLNFPDISVYHGDIHKLTVKQCLKMTGLEPGELDLLDGSPPCQGFSTAGKRRIEDKRNQLYMQFVRLLRGLRPKVFVMENVSGLVKGKMKLIFADIMKELKASGYRVRCKLLNAMYFNVPQSRQRLIWIGVRDDLARGVSFLRAESRPITVREAIPWIVKAIQDPKGQFAIQEASDMPCFTVKAGSSSHCSVEVETDISRHAIDREPQSGWQDAKDGIARMILDTESCPSILAQGRGFNGIIVKTEHTEKRKFTIAELKRIGAFPDQFEMVGSYAERWAVIGNSVPPLFMRAIAGHIRREILAES